MAAKLSAYLLIVTSVIFLCDVNAKDKLNGGDLKVLNKLNHAHGGPAMVFAEELKATLDKYLFGICPPSFKLNHAHGGPAMVFAEELKATLDKYLFGICPPSFKMQLGLKLKNSTAPPPTNSCEPDAEQADLAARLATLALRAHSASRSECSHLSAALASTFGELARTASNRQAVNMTSSDSSKKRKLSKSQKAKIQAKQRTALAVKKKAAAAAAAKITA